MDKEYILPPNVIHTHTDSETYSSIEVNQERIHISLGFTQYLKVNNNIFNLLSDNYPCTTVQRYENHATTVSSQFSHFCLGNEDNKRQVLNEDQRTQGQRHYAQYESDAETKSRRWQHSWLRCDVAAGSAAFIDILEASPDSIFCLCICVPSAQNFRILLALLVVSLPFCASLSHSLFPLYLPLCCTPPFMHGLRFRLMRCEFIAKCNTRCLLSPLSHFCSLGLSAVKQRRHRRTRQTRSKAFC